MRKGGCCLSNDEHQVARCEHTRLKRRQSAAIYMIGSALLVIGCGCIWWQLGFVAGGLALMVDAMIQEGGS